MCILHSTAQCSISHLILRKCLCHTLATRTPRRMFLSSLSFVPEMNTSQLVALSGALRTVLVTPSQTEMLPSIAVDKITILHNELLARFNVPRREQLRRVQRLVFEHIHLALEVRLIREGRFVQIRTYRHLGIVRQTQHVGPHHHVAGQPHGNAEEEVSVLPTLLEASRVSLVPDLRAVRNGCFRKDAASHEGVISDVDGNLVSISILNVLEAGCIGSHDGLVGTSQEHEFFFAMDGSWTFQFVAPDLTSHGLLVAVVGCDEGILQDEHIFLENLQAVVVVSNGWVHVVGLFLLLVLFMLFIVDIVGCRYLDAAVAGLGKGSILGINSPIRVFDFGGAITVSVRTADGESDANDGDKKMQNAHSAVMESGHSRRCNHCFSFSTSA
mmetsp:Transcript_7261/g.19664  ORF Transcript_7261/g.19664 Transcript_7261/m.19664 type:complete len:385 (-) Transcript_7261:250-1404(-)